MIVIFSTLMQNDDILRHFVHLLKSLVLQRCAFILNCVRIHQAQPPSEVSQLLQLVVEVVEIVQSCVKIDNLEVVMKKN